MPHEDENLPPAHVEAPDETDAHARRELLVMEAGAQLFGVFADEADCVVEGLRPTPLPHAPAPVVGVVCVRGRMRTVLDPRLLLLSPEPTGEHSDAQSNAQPDAQAGEAQAGQAQKDMAGEPPVHLRFVVALRGDEQLALSVARVARIVEISTEAIQPRAHAASLLRGVISDDGVPVFVLDPVHLFDAALYGSDRRRRRT